MVKHLKYSKIDVEYFLREVYFKGVRNCSEMSSKGVGLK